MRCQHCKQVLVYDPPSGQNLPPWDGDYGVMCPVLSKKNKRPTFCEEEKVHPKWKMQPYPKGQVMRPRPEYDWPEKPEAMAPPPPEDLTEDPKELKAICKRLRRRLEEAEDRAAAARSEADHARRPMTYTPGCCHE